MNIAQKGQAPPPPSQGLQAWVGEAGTGKTAGLILRVKAAIQAGLPADRLTVWVANPHEVPRWQEALAPLPPQSGQAYLGSFQAWWPRELQAWWPWLAAQGAPAFPPDSAGLMAQARRHLIAAQALGEAGLWEEGARWLQAVQALQAVDSVGAAWGLSEEKAVEAVGGLFSAIPPEVQTQMLLRWRQEAWALGIFQGGVGLEVYAKLLLHPPYQGHLQHRAGLVVVDGATHLPPVAWRVLAALGAAGAHILLAQDDACSPGGWEAAGPEWAKAWWAKAQRSTPRSEGPAAWCRAAAKHWLGEVAQPVPSSGGVHAALAQGEGSTPAWLQRARSLMASGTPPSAIAVVLPHLNLESLAALPEDVPWQWGGANPKALDWPKVRALFTLWAARWAPQQSWLAGEVVPAVQSLLGEAQALALALDQGQLPAWPWGPQAPSPSLAVAPEWEAWWGLPDASPLACWMALVDQHLMPQALTSVGGRASLKHWPAGLEGSLKATQKLANSLEATCLAAKALGEAFDPELWAAQMWAQSPSVPMKGPEGVGLRVVGLGQEDALAWPPLQVLLVADAAHPAYAEAPGAKAHHGRALVGQNGREQAAQRWQLIGQRAGEALEAFPASQSEDGALATGPFAAALCLCHANPPLAPGWAADGRPHPGSQRPFVPRQGQAQFLRHRKGPAAVLAVPGAGKSSSLVAYVVALLQEGQIPPWGIEVVTHTRVAAKHLGLQLGRAMAAAGMPPGGVQVGTVHALARRLLRHQDPRSLPHPVGQNRVGNQDAAWVEAWAEALRQQHQDTDGELWDRHWNHLEGVLLEENTQGFMEDQLREAAEAIWRLAWAEGSEGLARLAAEAPQKPLSHGLAWRFEGIRQARGLHGHELDVAICLDLLRQKPELAEAWQGAGRILLEDEAQDTNPAQVALLEALAGHCQAWVRVGDPNQSIFGFGGADPQALVRHAKAWTTYTFNEASRSSPKVAQCANAWVLAHRRGLAPEDEGPLFPATIQCAAGAPEDEAQALRILAPRGRGTPRAVQDLVEAWPTKAPEESWAMLIPFNGLMNEIEGQLRAMGLATLRAGEGHGLADAVRQASWPLQGLLLGPAWGHPLAWASDQKLWAKAFQEAAEPSTWEARPQPPGLGVAPLAFQQGQLNQEAVAFWWWAWQGQRRQAPWSPLPKAFALTGDRLALRMAMEEAKAQAIPHAPDRVVLLTVHGAKGLEFDRVWLPAWDSYLKQPTRCNPLRDRMVGAWEGRRTGQSQPHPTEVHRLARQRERDERLRQAYVALSRAKRQITLSEVGPPQANPITWSWEHELCP